MRALPLWRRNSDAKDGGFERYLDELHWVVSGWGEYGSHHLQQELTPPRRFGMNVHCSAGIDFAVRLPIASQQIILNESRIHGPG